MSIEFHCLNPDCGKRLKVADDQAGKKVRCPECKTVCITPSAPVAETAAQKEGDSGSSGGPNWPICS